MNEIPLDTLRDKIRKDYISKLQWLLFLRVVLSTFLLGAFLIINSRETLIYLNILNTLIGINVLVSLLSAIFLEKVKNIHLHALLQIIWDIIFVTLVVSASGAGDSIFPFLYFLTIINASVVLKKKNAFSIAIGCMFLYGLVIIITNYIDPTEEYDLKRSSTYFIYVIAFFLVAFAGSFLSEQLRKTSEYLEEKQRDIYTLKTLNENIVKSVNMGLITLDNNLNVTSFNKTAEEITKIPFEKAYGKNIKELFPNMIDISEDYYKKKEDSSEYTLFRRFELPFKRDKEEIYLGFNIGLLKDNLGKVIGNILTFQDVTKLKEMEEKIRKSDKLAAVGKLAAGIAHEIRNPLASISGSIQMLKSDLELSPIQKNLMDIILRETDRLNNLITDFLIYARPSQNILEGINLNDIVNNVVYMFINNSEYNKKIRITKKLGKDVFIRADSEKIKQVIWNLIKNAAEAMPDGGLIEISTSNNSNKIKEEVCLKIKDSGIGIEPQNIDKIFEPFFTTKESGTGLGLAIAYRIIEGNNGRINVESKTNNGTTFTIYLPASEKKR